MWHTVSPFLSYSSLSTFRQGLSLAWTVSPKDSPVSFSPSQGSELMLPNPAFLKWILGMELHSWDLQGKHLTNYLPRSCTNILSHFQKSLLALLQKSLAMKTFKYFFFKAYDFCEQQAHGWHTYKQSTHIHQIIFLKFIKV